jgi:hypothetical protein
MTRAQIEDSKEAVTALRNVDATNPAKVEVLLDRLATALSPLVPGVKATDLEAVLKRLPVSKEIKSKLEEVYEELYELNESRSYDDGELEDDEDDEVLSGLIEEFCELLEENIDEWEEQCEG